jgi:hypothetical protein
MGHENETQLRAQALEARFEAAGWGLLLIMFGALVLPQGTAEFVLVAAAGAAMLGLNALRVRCGVPVSWFGIILGAVALVAGLAAIVGVTIPAFALLLMLLGLAMIVGAIVRRPAEADGAPLPRG